MRIERLSEALEVIRGLLAGETVTFSGEHYSIDGLQGLPAPVRPGGPPLIVAGGSERVLRLAARTADIVGVKPAMGACTGDDFRVHDNLKIGGFGGGQSQTPCEGKGTFAGLNRERCA